MRRVGFAIGNTVHEPEDPMGRMIFRITFTTPPPPTSVLRHIAGKPSVSKKARLRSSAAVTKPSKDIT